MRMYRIYTLLLAMVCVVSSAQTLKKSVTYERLQRHDATLPVIGRIQPVESSLDRPSLWSVGCETLDRDYAVFDNFRQYVGETVKCTENLVFRPVNGVSIPVVVSLTVTSA